MERQITTRPSDIQRALRLLPGNPSLLSRYLREPSLVVISLNEGTLSESRVHSAASCWRPVKRFAGEELQNISTKTEGNWIYRVGKAGSSRGATDIM